MTIKGIAQMKFCIEFEGTETELVAIADRLSLEHFEERMDSLDLGDAMGVISCIALQHPDEEGNIEGIAWHFDADHDSVYKWERI